MTASLVSSQLILQAGGGAPCEQLAANFNEFVGAYVEPDAAVLAQTHA